VHRVALAAGPRLEGPFTGPPLTPADPGVPWVLVAATAGGLLLLAGLLRRASRRRRRAYAPR
jgi:hypothetical protein